MIGTLGDVVFRASGEEVLTLSDLQREGSANYAEHAVMGGKPLLEFTGPGLESFTFEILLATDLGIDPGAEAKRLRALRDKGEAVLFVLGEEPQGTGLWLIEQISEAHDHLDSQDAARLIKLSVTIKEYPETKA